MKDGESVEELRSAKTVRYCSAARFRPWMFRFAVMVPQKAIAAVSRDVMIKSLKGVRRESLACKPF